MAKTQQIYDIYPALKHPEKYKGTRPISTRSSWESSFILKYLDVNQDIFEWGSESIIIPYIKPTDGRTHRYFLDFNFKAKTKSGGVKEFWVEVKPHNQTIPPKEPTRKTKSYANQVMTYMVNQAKWSSCSTLVEKLRSEGKNIEFIILTEKDTGIFK